MTMTFSRLNTASPKAQGTATSLASNASRGSQGTLVTQIESALNFSKEFSLSHSPESLIINKTLKSVIFKVKESQLQQTITYHFWKQSLHGPEHYTILVCTKDQELISIVFKSEDISPKFFKITGNNEVDIIIYDSCRP